MQSDEFIGLTLAGARALAAANDLRLEILDDWVVDAMVDPRRVRVVVTDGVIAQAWMDVPSADPDGY